MIKILAKTKQMKIMFCNVKGKVTVTGRATTLITVVRKLPAFKNLLSD